MARRPQPPDPPGSRSREDEAEATLGSVLAGEATPAQIGAFLTLLHAKGETTDEVTGLARAMVEAAVPLTLPVGPDAVVDLVGTGGDRLSSINVTTLAALVVAGCGVTVCKHGGRSASSSVGSADVLEALGVAIEIGPVGVARCVAEAGIGFCFAQRFHPAMRFVAPIRRELGVPTIFNYLGPLTNPSRTRHQLVGVNDPAMATVMATVLGATGSRRAMIIYADDGLDELSVTSPSTVLELNGDGDGSYALSEWRVDPALAGLRAGHHGRPAGRGRRIQRRRHPLGARRGAGGESGHRGAQCRRRPDGDRPGRRPGHRSGAGVRIARQRSGRGRARPAGGVVAGRLGRVRRLTTCLLSRGQGVPRTSAPPAGLTRHAGRGA